MKIIILYIIVILIFPCAQFAFSETAPTILFISVDTLRADNLGCYGYPHSISPNIDYLSRKSILFTDSLTTIGKTGPAFASLFTSHYPPTTGARRNGMRLRPDLPTLAELLKKKDYTTGAIISNWTLKNRLSGLKRGFDYYNDDLPEVRNGPVAKEKYAPEVTEQALSFITTCSSRPLFFWVHYSDPHTPYELHRNFRVNRVEAKSHGGQGWRKKRRYRSEIRFTDYWIGKLIHESMDHFENEPLEIIFFSDHGESLGEHNSWGHGKNVFNPNLHIPLLFSGTCDQTNTLNTSPVSIIDIMPTILDKFTFQTLPIMDGISITTEASNKKGNERKRYAFSDRGVKFFHHAPKKYEDPLSMCLVKKEWKAIFYFPLNVWKYFNLKTDPAETNAIQSAPPYLSPAMKNQLTNWYHSLPKHFRRPKPQLTDEDIECLRSLGYVE